MDYSEEQIVPIRQWKALAGFFRSGFFLDLQNRIPLVASLFVNSILWVAILIKIRAENKPVPLHYNVFYGIDFVGPGFWFLQLPLVGLVLLTLNTLIGKRLYHSERFLSAVLCYASLIVQIVLLVATVSLIVVNT